MAAGADTTKVVMATMHRFPEHCRVVAATTATAMALRSLKLQSFKDVVDTTTVPNLPLRPIVKAFKGAEATIKICLESSRVEEGTTRICLVSCKAEGGTTRTCQENSRAEEVTIKTCLASFRVAVATTPTFLAHTKVATDTTKAR